MRLVRFAALALVLALATRAAATGSGVPVDENAASVTGESTRPQIEQSFLYLTDPHAWARGQFLAGYALAFSSSAGAIRPIPGHFDQEGLVHALSLEVGLASRVSLYGSTLIAQAIGKSDVDAVAVQAGVRVLLTDPRSQHWHVVAQAAFLREFGASLGVIGEVTASYDIGRVRMAAALHAEHIFAPGRDPVDLYAVAGVSVRVAPIVRLGAEYIVQDIEAGFDDGDDAEKGIRHYVGGNVALALYRHHVLVTGGAAAQASAQSGVLARAAFTYVY